MVPLLWKHWQLTEALNRVLYGLASPLPGTYLGALETYVCTRTCTQMFTAAYLSEPKSGTNPNAHQLINE